MRQLTDFEIDNTIFLARKRINYALLEPTRTGLEKSIMDATAPVRVFLKDKELHDYELQGQGQDHKKQVDSYILFGNTEFKTKSSLYRPITKNGDPRIWIANLKKFVNPNDIIVLINYGMKLVCINISRANLDELEKINNLFGDLVHSLSEDMGIASELAQKLKNIAQKGPYRADLNDTAIGFLLETLLGIPRNSNPQPDYKGIEIKSHRVYGKGRENRVNLFAKVANWDLSNFKSSREILEQFGYDRDGILKLYCTISTQSYNSQGLKFRINEDKNWLQEFCNDNKIGDVAVWTLERLHEKLLEKHNETFWVAAKSIKCKKLGYEDFWYNKVLHTQKPIPAQFDLLLSQGQITMDHLIKRKKNGCVSEKGPLFKIEKRSLNVLFPIVKEISLIN